MFILSDVYYAGGTVDKNISSKIVSDAIVLNKKCAKFIPKRIDLIAYLKANLSEGDVALLMGARDTTLSEFASEVFESI